jgi:hypothetical protein
MRNGTLAAAILVGCSTLIATAGTVALTTAASAGKSVVKGGDLAKINSQGDDSWFFLPIAPSYLAYDYPYYYSRGYYPTHIGPGYIYYGQPYYVYRSSYGPKHDSRCVHRRKCVTD